MIEVTPYQLQLLHHTLGVNPERRNSYRNHFVAGPGHQDMEHLEVLVATGYMTRGYRPAFLEDDDVVFQCTDTGRTYALEKLPPAPKYSRYQEYQRSECSEGFAWFLGFDAPEFEGYRCHGSPFVFGRSIPESWVRMRSSRAVGDFCKTKKDAKSSYKEALRKRRAADRVKP